MKSICVFCGSNSGRSPLYHHAANELGQLLAQREIRLVYGGGSVGLMGLVAALGLGIVGLIVLSRSSNRFVSVIGTGLLVLLLAGNVAMKCVDGELPFCSRGASR